MVRDFLWVGIGGAVGSMARYAATMAVLRVWANPLPLGTLLINIIGCFIIGVLYGCAQRFGWSHGSSTWLLLATGLCGGFTTFSAFALESVRLLQQQLSLQALGYILLSVIGGILSCFLGAYLSK